MSKLRGKSVLLMAGVAAVGLSVVGPAFAADSLTIISWGGAYQESQRKAFFEPFAKDTGTKITEGEYNGEIAKIRAMVESNSVSWDVVDVDSQTMLAACAEGILTEFDWSKLQLDKAEFIGGDVSPCGVPNILYSTIFAFDNSKYDTNAGPKTVADVFDLEKFPGKRALQKSPFINLEWALIADGVPADKVYEVLATPEGVDQAFAKLDTIKSEVIWWEAGAQPPQILADGQAAIVSAWNGRIYSAIVNDKKPFTIIWDHQALDWDWWAVPKGAPNTEAAYKFISYSSQPAPMAEQTKYISYGPSNRAAVDKIAPDVLAQLPTAPDNLKTAFGADAEFWADHGEELRERFNAWLAM